MKSAPTITPILLDCYFGAIRVYCAPEPDEMTLSISLNVKDAEGMIDPEKVRAKDYLIGVLNEEDKKIYFSSDAGSGDFDITAAFANVEEFLAYLKPYGFLGTRLKNRASA